MAKSFGDMLRDRRRQMGLSVQQVANTIKIRPQIIEFFEENDYASMPQRGYAQGMISSYARYLGLNPREVVDAYFDGLYDFERGSGFSGVGGLDRAQASNARIASAQDRHHLMASQPSRSRFGKRPPQAGYVPEAGSTHDSISAEQLQSNMRGHGYSQGAATSGRRSQNTLAGYEPGEASFRIGRGSSYRSPYRASGESRSSRGVSGHRPQGRGPCSSQAQGRTQRRGSRDGSYGHARPDRGGHGRGLRTRGLASVLSSPRFVMCCLAVIALLLILVVVLVVRGCTGASAANMGSQGSSGSTSSAMHLTDLGSSSSSASRSAAAAGGSAAADSQEVSEYTVTIDYTGDSTAWLEVKLNGQYDESGGTVTEGFSKEYTVTDSIEISTNKPSDIVVTCDGERVSYDSKSSGVGRITIAVPKSESTTEESSTDEATAEETATTDDTWTDETWSEEYAG